MTRQREIIAVKRSRRAGVGGGRPRWQVADCADLARPAHVSRARLTQIMNLTLLAPDIQEAILFLPPTDGRRAPVRERHIRAICALTDCRKQRRMWGEMVVSLDGGAWDPTRRQTG